LKHIENFTGFVNESYAAGAEAFVENMKHALEDELVMSFSIFSSAKQLENGTLCVYITDETIDLTRPTMTGLQPAAVAGKPRRRRPAFRTPIDYGWGGEAA
jgi:hypothetical protein